MVAITKLVVICYVCIGILHILTLCSELQTPFMSGASATRPLGLVI